jgi:co-chaperonin GroES (HSP10)
MIQKCPIDPMSYNIVGIKVDKKESKYVNDIFIQHSETDNASLIEVVAVGKDVTDIVIGDKVFIPLTAIRVPFDGVNYAICSVAHIYAKLIQF